MLSGLSSPANNQRGPVYMHQVLAAMHQANGQKLPLTLVFSRHGETVGLFCRYPRALRAAVDAPLFAKYPSVKLERLPDDESLDGVPAGHCVFTATLRLMPDLFPIRRYAEFEDALSKSAADPMGGILEILTPGSDDPTRARIAIRVVPIDRRERRRKRARWAVDQLARRAFRENSRLTRIFALTATSHWLPVRLIARLLVLLAGTREEVVSTDDLTTSPGRAHDREDEVQAASDKVGHHLFDVQIRLTVTAPLTAKDRAVKTLRSMAGAFGPFTSKRRIAFRLSRIKTSATPPGKWARRGFLLSDEELATLWHPTTEHVRAERMKTSEFTELEPPTNLPAKDEPEVAVLGQTKYRSRNAVFGVRLRDRRRHLAVIGKTGMGKSTLLLNLVSSDIRAGRGVALIDPHGDLADAVLQTVPRSRTNDVVLFDAGDRAHPIAYNPLACRDASQRDLVAAGVVSAFKKLYGESWGPRLEYILFNTLLTLVHVPGTTLLSVMRILSDEGYRRRLLSRINDPVVHSFWSLEYDKYPQRLRMEAIAPIQNKVGQFLASPVSRAIVGQRRGSLDLRQIMDEGKIFIVNLSKGRIGEEPSTLLGALLVTGLQLAAMSRSDQPLEKRRDAFVYVDEFQNFATESFATILSEARKYRLNLTIANQYLAQMDEKTLEAVFGNVGSLLCFQVGNRDAEVLAEELGGELTEEDVIRLPRFTAYAKLLVDGMPSRPFSMETLPPKVVSAKRDRTEVLRNASRRRYGRPAERVGAEIRKALQAA